MRNAKNPVWKKVWSILESSNTHSQEPTTAKLITAYTSTPRARDLKILMVFEELL